MSDETNETENEEETPEDVITQAFTLNLTPNMIDRVCESVAEKIAQRERTKFSASISKRLENIADEIIAERLATELESVLSEGWVQTNTYGEKASDKKITIRDRLARVLESKASDYDNKRWIDKTMQNALAVNIQKHIDPIIADMAMKARAQVDSLLNARFAEALRTSLGLK